MSYQVLARKYRPKTLSDLKGQDVLVQSLRNAFHLGRVAQAFILTGIRGVGKTTTARILAKNFNCENLTEQAESCGTCSHCQAIDQSCHPDVLEMDGATHTSVNDIRAITDTIHYAPTLGKKRVYIIDEIHMLSQSAFNALLKTLEEPPAHVVFIFATTEVRKIPATVISRCQRFDLSRLDAEALAAHLQHVLTLEGFSAEPAALALIAQSADGSVRDSLTLLDQAILLAKQESSDATCIRETTTRAMLGYADYHHSMQLLCYLLEGSAQEALEIFRSTIAQGSEVIAVFEMLLELVHQLTLYKAVPHNTIHTPHYNSEITQQLQEIAKKTSIPSLTRMWQLLLKGIQEIKQSHAALAAGEMVLIRCCYIKEFLSPATLQEQPAPSRVDSTPAAQAAAPQAPALQPAPTSYEALTQLFLEKRQMLLYQHLHGDVAVTHYEPGRVVLTIETQKSHLIPKDFCRKIKSLLEEWTGNSWDITLNTQTDAAPPSLQETQQQQAAEQKEQLRQHPTVQSALSLFPNATIMEINPS